ncbi:hypothetical protein KKF70_00400 [bacterium]|nr:hypothetical protein [bacterium]MBU3930748.1 hypothetical protein [bacterium]
MKLAKRIEYFEGTLPNRMVVFLNFPLFLHNTDEICRNIRDYEMLYTLQIYSPEPENNNIEIMNRTLSWGI